MNRSWLLAFLIVTALVLIKGDDKPKPGGGKGDRGVGDKGTRKRKVNEELKKLGKDFPAGKEKNISRDIKDEGRLEDVKELVSKLNCSRLIHFILNRTKTWSCDLLKGFDEPLEKCRKKSGKDKVGADKVADVRVRLIRCGKFPKNLTKDYIKEIGKKGGFKHTPKDMGEIKKILKALGQPETWTKDDLFAIKGIVDKIPRSTWKKLKKEVLHAAINFTRHAKKETKKMIFQLVYPKSEKLSVMNITSICRAGYVSVLRPPHLKDFPDAALEKISKCFGSSHARDDTRREFVRMAKGNLTTRNIKLIAPAVAGIPISILKRYNVTKRILEVLLNTTKGIPKVPKNIARELVRVLKKMHPGDRDTWSTKLKGQTRNLFSDDLASLKKDNVKLREKCDMWKGNSSGESQGSFKQNCRPFMNKDDLRKSVTKEDLEVDDDINLDEDLDCDDDDEDDVEDDDGDDDDDYYDDGDDDGDGEDDEEKVKKPKNKFNGPRGRYLLVKVAGAPANFTKLQIRAIIYKCAGKGLTLEDLRKIKDEDAPTFYTLIVKGPLRADQMAVMAKRLNGSVSLDDSDFIEGIAPLVPLFGVKELKKIPANATEAARDAIKESVIMFKEINEEAKASVAEVALEFAEVDDLSKMDADKLEIVGHIVCWLKDKDFDKIPEKIFLDILPTLRDGLEDHKKRPAYKKMAEKIMGKVRKAKKATPEISEEGLDDIGGLYVGLTGEDAKHLTRQAAKELAKKKIENKEVALEVFEKIKEDVQGRRKKRATIDYSTKDANYFLDLGSAIIGLTAADIKTINKDVIADIVYQVSMITSWSSDQLEAWADKYLEASGTTVDQLTADQLLELNEFAKGFSAAEIGQMNLAEPEVIASLGSRSNYSTEQVTKAFEKIKSLKAVAQMTGTHLISLGYFALGMTPTDIGAINKDHFATNIQEFGSMPSGMWSQEQLTKLKEKTVVAFGNPSQWDAGDFATAGVIFGGFSDDEIRALNADFLQYVTTDALKSLSPSKFKLLSTDILLKMSVDQAAAITEEQKGQLSDSQKVALQTAMVQGFDNSLIGDGQSTTPPPALTKPSDDGSKASIYGIVSFVLPLLCARFLF